MKATSLRWVMLVAGCLVMASMGFLYAWSSLSVPISAEFGLSATQTSLVFTFSLWAFCLGGFVGAKVSRRFGARTTFAMAALLFLVAFLLPAFLAHGSAAWMVCLAYGLCGGCGIGMAYTIALDTVLPWFPGFTGLASGALLLCYGSSTMLVSSGASRLFEVVGWRTAFVVLALAIAALVFASSRALRLPSEGEERVLLGMQRQRGHLPEGWPANEVSEDGASGDVVTLDMVRDARFILFATWVLLLCSANMGVVGAAHQIAASAGASHSAAVAFVGLLSLCNGLGRIANGILFDALGAVRTMRFIALFFVVGSMLLLVSLGLRSGMLAGVGLAVVGLGVGGSPVVSSGFVRKEFGPTHYAANFSTVNLMIAPGGLIGPAVASLSVELTGSYGAGLAVLLVFSLLALATTFALRRTLRG